MESSTHISRPSMGLLQLDEGNKRYELTRHAPAEALSPFVKHYWMVSWDLTGLESYPQHVVPNPCVNLVVERGNTFSSVLPDANSPISFAERGRCLA